MPFTDKAHNGDTVSIFPALMFAHGDAPWSSKRARGCGHTACNGCWRCGIVGVTKTPDGAKIGGTAFGGYSEAAPCRTWDEGTGEWVEGEVQYARQEGLSQEPCLDRSEARRLKTPDDMFIMRGNTADHITAEEMGSFVEHTATQANPGMLSSMASTVMLCHSVPLVGKN
jgi:hypothetical protein